MEFKYSYKFTETAAQDLDDILHYINDDLCNQSAAKSFYNDILSNINNTRLFPLSGTLVRNEYLQDKSVRQIVVGNYILYYIAKENEKTIYIVRIVYGKMNLEQIDLSIKD